jgi:hypothetical protein
MPLFTYNAPLMGDSLDFEANLGVPLWSGGNFCLGIRLNLELTYKRDALSFILENHLTSPITERVPIFLPFTFDVFTPKVKYNFFFNTGTLYIQADLPISIIPDAFENIGMHFYLGCDGENGIGLKTYEYNYLKTEAKFFQHLFLEASYDKGSLRARNGGKEELLSIRLRPVHKYQFYHGAHTELHEKN